jgi:hypothetical protein
MMDIFTYRCIGSETKSGGNTIIDAPPIAGMTVTNLFVNGSGQAYSPEDVDSGTASVVVQALLERGDLVQILFKKLPRVDASMGFEPSGFESFGFA